MKNKINKNVPLNSDKYTRNERIYETLISMGLIVEPQYDKLKRIKYLIVSTGQIERETN